MRIRIHPIHLQEAAEKMHAAMPDGDQYTLAQVQEALDAYYRHYCESQLAEVAEKMAALPVTARPALFNAELKTA